MKKSITTKQQVKPHTAAKLDFYRLYLDRYLPIVRQAGFAEIVIFDIYAGEGIYKDNKAGSPVVAIKSIRRSTKIKTKKIINKNISPVTLIVNELDKQKVEKLKIILEKENSDNVCKIVIRSYDALEFIPKIIKYLKQYEYKVWQKINKKKKFLLFIDPYTYSHITKQNLKDIIEIGNNEIIIFLPVSFVYRFKNYKKNKKVQNFYKSFFGKIIKTTNQKDLISKIEKELNFNADTYATSFYIQRNKQNNYYAVFFITQNLKGFEEIINVKWKIDEFNGSGFNISDATPSLFKNEFLKEKLLEINNQIKELILKKLEQKNLINNKEMTIFALKQGYRLPHFTTALKELENENKIKVETIKAEKRRKGSFYLGYDALKKNNFEPKINIMQYGQ